jgi:hypothetical protein
MKNAKPNRRVAAPVRHAKCSVLPIAQRVGELWDAHEAAEVREFNNKSNPDMPRQIEGLRMTVEETASFVRARWLAGALFQVGLAQEAATHLGKTNYRKDVRQADPFAGLGGPTVAGRMPGGGLQSREGRSRDLPQQAEQFASMAR